MSGLVSAWILKVTRKVLKNIKKQASWWMSTGHQGNQALSCIYDVPFGERRSHFALMTTVARVNTRSDGKASGERGTLQVPEQRSLCCQTVWFLNWGGYLCSVIGWSLPTQSSMKLYIFHTQLFHSFCTTSWRQQSPTFMSEVISNLIQVLGKKGVRTTSNIRKCPRNQPSMSKHETMKNWGSWGHWEEHDEGTI